MKNLIIMVGLTLMINSCKKNEDSTNTIKGQIFNCNNGVLIPNYLNRTIDLFQQKNGSNNDSKVLANTTTDAQGNFSFTYSTNNSSDKLMLRASSGFGFSTLMEEIPIEDINNLKVVLPAYNLVVGLNVIKLYSNNDSLYITKPDSNSLFKIKGPFISGRLFTCKNVLLRGTLKYSSNEQKLSSGVYNGNTGVDLSKIYLVENNKLCGDTVYVNIDVR